MKKTVLSSPDLTHIKRFQSLVYDFYLNKGRELVWRIPEQDGSYDPYKVLVSELMLQQTQVSRVTPKFEMFIKLFPDIHSLAEAELADVLIAWSGLGYNRRAKFLYHTARIVVTEYNGQLPKSQAGLVALPGIGVNTAAAILAYSYNEPVIFIETNIRTVFLHHFFPLEDKVADSRLIPYIEATLDKDSPRQWYYALMDYGSCLKKTVKNPSTRSKHFTKQSPFQGSLRQIRGQVIKLLASGTQTETGIKDRITDQRLPVVLEQLETEGLIGKRGATYYLGK